MVGSELALMAKVEEILERGSAWVRSAVREEIVKWLQARGADKESVVAYMASMNQHLATIAQQNYEMHTENEKLRQAKARLEAMQSEGLFAFAKQVEPRAFKIICTILTKGDVAKAARELKVGDSTLRDEIKSWPGRGKVYAALADLVRWRKRVGRCQEVALNDSILLERTKTVDHPALLSDLLDGLLSMTEGNWADKAEALADTLRPHVER